MLSLSDDPQVCANSLVALEGKLFESQGGQFCLGLLGTASLCPDFVLALCDLLANRPAGIKLITHARSSLLHGNVLVWLQGQQRLIRKDAWIYFRKPKIGAFAINNSPLRGREELGDWEGHPEPKKPMGPEVDYAQIFAQICRHLPCKMAQRRIWSAELAEWNLIGGPLH